jgi:hypothetical protein
MIKYNNIQCQSVLFSDANGKIIFSLPATSMSAFINMRKLVKGFAEFYFIIQRGAIISYIISSV